MKFETIALHSLFTACLLICALTFGAMLFSPAPVNTLAAHAATATLHGSAG